MTVKHLESPAGWRIESSGWPRGTVWQAVCTVSDGKGRTVEIMAGTGETEAEARESALWMDAVLRARFGVSRPPIEAVGTIDPDARERIGEAASRKVQRSGLAPMAQAIVVRVPGDVDPTLRDRIEDAAGIEPVWLTGGAGFADLPADALAALDRSGRLRDDQSPQFTHEIRGVAQRAAPADEPSRAFPFPFGQAIYAPEREAEAVAETWGLPFPSGDATREEWTAWARGVLAEGSRRSRSQPPQTFDPTADANMLLTHGRDRFNARFGEQARSDEAPRHCLCGLCMEAVSKGRLPVHALPTLVSSFEPPAGSGHPRRDAPEIEYLARLAHARGLSMVPWGSLSERQRASTREGICAVLDILHRVSGREDIATEWARLTAWVHSKEATSVLERHEAGR